MKIAVLADIHGNFPALQTVADHIDRWQPDAVVVGGDVVNRGPRSRACLDFVRHKQQSDGWLTVRGNHEEYVMDYDRPEAVTSGIQFEMYQTAHWVYEQLGGDVSPLEAMPFQVSLEGPTQQEVRIVHASMENNRSGIFPGTPARRLRSKIQHPEQPPPAIMCVGHTHVPLVRHIDDTMVVNVGAVGLPFDGDPRAAYGRLTWQRGRWTVEIIRLEYDRDRARQDFFDTGFIDEAGPIARLIFDELQTAQSRLYQWTVEYEGPIRAGEISLHEAVTNFLIEQHGVEYG